MGFFLHSLQFWDVKQKAGEMTKECCIMGLVGMTEQTGAVRI